MKIALGQINPTVGDFSGNAARIIEFARRAQSAGAGLILFPELSVCGYPPRDLVERPSFAARNHETVLRIAEETRGISVICGTVTPAESATGKTVMNSAAWLMDGKIALIRGDVDAWAGLDPMMAQAEIEDGAQLLFRKPDANTWGILNVREDFLKDHPDLVRRVLAVYNEARKYALANYDDLKKIFIAVTKLPDVVVDKQLKERTDLTYSRVGTPQRESILAAGLALQQAGVVPANVNINATVDALLDDRITFAGN